MAFNFNWSPLTADSDFYSRAKELLTTALNKSPKPPIIVDDILVNELNLGSTPPELEILEIGDLAEDRFRGIFKMCYSGDAFLTLKTRVQANPLNTYLSTKPSFTSPQPLAAASGLTIPIQITLSDIKLSAFIILVFSKQKGVTLVFRNDPLESLKVSSTFDSIPFVRDYLQKEIEGQVRVLLMEELPAIIHRLSLRLWVPEYRCRDEEHAEKTREGQKPVDPLAAPPQDAVDSFGYLVDATEVSYLSFDSNSSDTTALFSQKNLLRLAALTDSHRTLSLFTPSIRDAVFRAWAGSTERGDVPGSNTPVTPVLSRTHSTLASTSTIYSFSDDLKSSLLPSRPPLASYGSTTGLSLGANRHPRSHTGRKKKTRVVNLRKRTNMNSDTESVSGESTTSAASSSVALSSIEMALPPQIPEERDDGVVTPPRSPLSKVRFRSRQDSIDLGSSPPKLRPLTPVRKADSPRLRVTDTGTQTPPLPLDGSAMEPAAEASSSFSDPEKSQYHFRSRRPIHELYHLRSYGNEKGSLSASASSTNLNLHYPAPLLQSLEPSSSSAIGGGGILERAWMMKMAADIARRHDEKVRSGAPTSRFWDAGLASDDGREDSPPPAYEVS